MASRPDQMDLFGQAKPEEDAARSQAPARKPRPQKPSKTDRPEILLDASKVDHASDVSEGVSAGSGKRPASQKRVGVTLDASVGVAEIRPIADAAARSSIADDLDSNMVVRAGAGAGKTHELVQRMVEVVRSGRSSVEHMAAITFTRKAAGELRMRFAAALEAVHKEAADPDVTANVEAAVRNVDRCYIGTIHGFCSRMLRERPIEAGLSPDFAEVDEREEWLMINDAWQRFGEKLIESNDPSIAILHDLELRHTDLFGFFLKRYNFSDVPLKPATERSPDLKRATEAVLDFVRECEPHVRDVSQSTDALGRAVRHSMAFLGNHGIVTDRDRVRLLKIIDAGRVTLKSWSDRDFAKKSKERLAALKEGVIRPALTSWYEYAYCRLGPFLDSAVDWFRRERLRENRLTFQDLLEYARHLLRDHPEVRTYFQRRYRRIFVDEFQDTDPLQAEMLMYLAADDPNERDWRKVNPNPGSLFIVGDEKQAIYRFRRADVDIFRFVTKRISETGGRVVELDTSFRSFGRLCAWINRTFEPLFGGNDGTYQSGFQPLVQHRPDGSDSTCVRRLVVDEHTLTCKPARAPVAEREAERVAEFIEAAMQGVTEFNSADTVNGVLPKNASPGDFLILTRTKKLLPVFASALEDRRIAYDITGGAGLDQSAELRALVEMLEAVAAPDDQVKLLAYLRGPLVGLSDEDLYDFKLGRGRFDFHWRQPSFEGIELGDRVSPALERLKSAERIMSVETPRAGIDRVMEELGLLPFGIAQSSGSFRIGSMLRALSYVSRWEATGMTWTAIVHELRSVLNDRATNFEGATLEAGKPDAVRIMNVHQAKGLQAPVVFLVDGAYGPSSRRPTSHVLRTGDAEYVSIRGERSTPMGRGGETIAQPPDWAEDELDESRHEAAEETRLLYVAATRAANLLIVSQPLLKSGRVVPIWDPMGAALQDVPVLDSVAASRLGGSGGSGIRSVEPKMVYPDFVADWARVKKPTYTMSTVSRESKIPVDPQADGYGRDYGTLVHWLFELALTDRLPEDPSGVVRRAVQDMGSGQHGGEEIVSAALAALDRFRQSDIWHRARGATRLLAEVPVAARVDTPDTVPNVTRGQIDLLFLDADGWVVCDYKTDAFGSEETRARLIDRYREQVMSYAAQWTAATTEPVVEQGLWLVQDHSWVPV